MLSKLLVHVLGWICLYVCTIAMITCHMVLCNKRSVFVSVSPVYVLPPRLDEQQSPSIFISIASYRDSRCVKTVQSAIRNARFPYRLYFGVCVQENVAIDDTFPDPCLWLHGNHQMHDHILIERVRHTDAKGPTYARYVCSTLYRGQDLFLQIDSHMEFVSDWDVHLVHQYNICAEMSGHHRVIISHYPPSCMTPEVVCGAVTVKMCLGHLEDPGIPSFHSEQCNGTSHPTTSWYIACGFMLAPGSFVNEVPYDPGLECMFWGEEVLLSARAWTSGYDIYNPAFALCVHQYTRVNSPNVVYDQVHAGTINEWTRVQRESVYRAMRTLNIMLPPNVPIVKPSGYGMGNTRTLNDYMRLSGVGTLVQMDVTNRATRVRRTQL